VLTVPEKDAELFRQKFLAEGKILAHLRHPHLVQVVDMGVDERSGAVYLVMSLVQGPGSRTRTLADVAPGSASEEQILGWFAELCDALSYVHLQGIVHRDVKLGNILLDAEGHVVLADFGVAKVVDAELRAELDVVETVRSLRRGTTSAHLLMGTIGYMAPEVARGLPPTPASDIYSLGVAFFRLLTNVWYLPPSSPVSSNSKVLDLLEMFDYRWRDVLPAMLQMDPADRPSSLAFLPDEVAPHEEEGVQ